MIKRRKTHTKYPKVIVNRSINKCEMLVCSPSVVICMCVTSANEETVLSSVTLMMFLMTPSSKPGNNQSFLIQHVDYLGHQTIMEQFTRLYSLISYYKTFKTRLDKFLENEDVRYNWKADILFTGSHSKVELINF